MIRCVMNAIAEKLKTSGGPSFKFGKRYTLYTLRLFEELRQEEGIITFNLQVLVNWYTLLVVTTLLGLY